MAAMSRRPLEVLSRSLARDMKRASDDVLDDWSPLLGSVNHVDRILDERPLRAVTGRSANSPPRRLFGMLRVCTENSNPDVMMVKPTEDRA
jgi:hypothetical protein